MSVIHAASDQHTEAALTPPCELLIGDQPCPAPATHLIRFTVQDRPVVPTPVSPWAAHPFLPRADGLFGCERCGRGESAPVHNRKDHQ